MFFGGKYQLWVFFTLTTAGSYLPPIMTLHDRHSHGCATGIIVAVNSTPRLLP